MMMQTNRWVGMSSQRPSSLPPLPLRSSHKACVRPSACLSTPTQHVWLARTAVAASGKLGLPKLPGGAPQQQSKLVRVAFRPAWWAPWTSSLLELPQEDGEQGANAHKSCHAIVPIAPSLGAGSLSGGLSGWGSLAVKVGSWADEEPDEEWGMVQAGEVSPLLSRQPLLEGRLSQDWDAQEGEGEGPAGGEAQAAQLAPASPLLSRPCALESAARSSSSSSSDNGSWAILGLPTTPLLSSSASVTGALAGTAASAQRVLAPPPGMSCAVTSFPRPQVCMLPATAAAAAPCAPPPALSATRSAMTGMPPPPGMGFNCAAPSPLAPPSASGALGAGLRLFARSTGMLPVPPRSAEDRAACRGGGSSRPSSGAGRNTTPSLAGHATRSRHRGGEPASRQSHAWSVELPCGAQELNWGCAIIEYC